MRKSAAKIRNKAASEVEDSVDQLDTTLELCNYDDQDEINKIFDSLIEPQNTKTAPQSTTTGKQTETVEKDEKGQAGTLRPKQKPKANRANNFSNNNKNKNNKRHNFGRNDGRYNQRPNNDNSWRFSPYMQNHNFDNHGNFQQQQFNNYENNFNARNNMQQQCDNMFQQQQLQQNQQQPLQYYHPYQQQRQQQFQQQQTQLSLLNLLENNLNNKNLNQLPLVQQLLTASGNSNLNGLNIFNPTFAANPLNLLPLHNGQLLDFGNISPFNLNNSINNRNLASNLGLSQIVNLNSMSTAATPSNGTNSDKGNLIKTLNNNLLHNSKTSTVTNSDGFGIPFTSAGNINFQGSSNNLHGNEAIEMKACNKTFGNVIATEKTTTNLNGDIDNPFGLNAVGTTANPANLTNNLNNVIKGSDRKAADKSAATINLNNGFDVPFATSATINDKSSQKASNKCGTGIPFEAIDANFSNNLAANLNNNRKDEIKTSSCMFTANKNNAPSQQNGNLNVITGNFNEHENNALKPTSSKPATSTLTSSENVADDFHKRRKTVAEVLCLTQEEIFGPPTLKIMEMVKNLAMRKMNENVENI